MSKISIRKKLVVTGIIILVLVGAGVGYAFYAGYFNKPTTSNDNEKDVIDTSSDQYKATLKDRDDKITSLIDYGSKRSIHEADQIVEEDIKKAEESGNDQYIHDTYSAKASLLINTGRAQQALDEILLPMEDKYEEGSDSRNEVYGLISWAYRELDNSDKADEYFNKIPPIGWD